MIENIESGRKYVLQRQTELRRVLTKNKEHQKSIEFFLHHHAMLHSAKMAQTELWSFEDAILDDMTEEAIRRIPHNCEHSVTWLLWHIARIEDVTMNVLVAGSPQIMYQEDWHAKLKVDFCDTGNQMSHEDVIQLSSTIDLDVLRAYRVAVGRRTRTVAKQLEPEDLKRKVDPARLPQLTKQGAVVPAAQGLIDYWRKRNIAGLLLMPATRHNIVHLNEALRMKHRCR